MPDLFEHSPLLAQLLQICSAASAPRVLLQESAPVLRDLTNSDRLSLLLPDCHGWAVEFADSPPGSDLSETGEPDSAASWVLDHGQPLHLNPESASDARGEERGLFSRGYRVCAYYPLRARGVVVGVLGLGARRAEALRTLEPGVLAVAANGLALALDNLTLRARVEEMERFQRERVYLQGETRTERDLRSLTGESAAMKAVRLAIQQVARTDSTVLILGETGTGKELIARAIHQLSSRRERLLVAVNCAALAPGVLASELFGHEQGAFTGATKRRLGRFELAHQGTLFLDEVGELPPEVQVLLLRALQERVIERVGGHEPVAVEVRVIAATHRDLLAAQEDGRFRADLFYRLNVFPIRVPPLRERREDIPDLVKHGLQHFGRRLNKPVTRLSPASMRLLQEYHWPGNVRELENLIERAVIVATGDTLEIDPNWLTPRRAPIPSVPTVTSLAGVEQQAILDALARCHGQIYGPAGAAAALGLKPTTLYGKMRKLGIARPPRPE